MPNVCPDVVTSVIVPVTGRWSQKTLVEEVLTSPERRSGQRHRLLNSSKVSLKQKGQQGD
jgi:hypothetical protein